MIIGIGNDIIEIERIKNAITKKGFIERYFTKKEIELFVSRKSNPEIIAGNFTIKEAVSKVFGSGVRGFSLIDIEVLRDSKGKPYVNLYRNAKLLAEQIGIKTLFVSIAHCKDYAVGFAVGEGE